jgi:hypothetical protein
MHAYLSSRAKSSDCIKFEKFLNRIKWNVFPDTIISEIRIKGRMQKLEVRSKRQKDKNSNIPYRVADNIDDHAHIQ